ncbi:16S rRNA (adenine(1518)-N(6)/adenine(1519)-N(6))-dimethyltransferase RsmA [Campylobacter sputorum]|uniref:16S rRNA (adenine(1518)-N(6)/adenine(1519)-N(6))- dimethyltransferase RsmA n=1 Tax=Campylobacter sputorum TaxID=206 RepID=UPI001E56858E|nr:16S rRNA (adenine(1518)-N(6)/adenine(1519)-N(6))-dimethyltransferase RsmA [Campylobacter sputorum]
MIKAKKHFGQNFLKDATVLNKIIQSIPDGEKNLVEIGPGLGDLTNELIKVGSVTCYEIDSDLCENLQSKFRGKIKLICDDALKVWESSSLSDEPYFLVANLPYYVATKMVLNAIDDTLCKGFVVMVQKEVAEKFCAKVGDKELSSLSIISNLNGDIELLFDVLRTSFNPPPKVTSSVIKFIKQDKKILDDLDYFKFKEFLKICFLSPRKMLIKNLSSKFAKDKLNEIFLNLDIQPTARAHEIDATVYTKIFLNLKAENGRKGNNN